MERIDVMKTVLLPVHPNWLELILSGKKTVEVKKTKPKEAVPFRVLLYCTKGPIELARDKNGNIVLLSRNKKADISDLEILSGKVIAEFVCDKVIFWGEEFPPPFKLSDACLSYREIRKYSPNGNLYGWHISDLKIYDKPKKLSEFRKPCENDLYCEECAMFRNFEDKCENSALQIKRPPQSWCYVEV